MTKKIKDPVGDRIKSKYENPFRATLPQRTNLLIRVDGRAFHTYTKKFERPYDGFLRNAMVIAGLETMQEIGGAKFAYGQSDEFSFLATDYDTHDTQMWFAGNKSKIESIAASVFTAEFNRFIWNTDSKMRNAYFDARAFIVPMQHEVINYFIWRQQDAIRNSVSMLARHHISAKKLHKVSTTEAKRMLSKEGVSWNDMPSAYRRGTALYKPEKAMDDVEGTSNGWYVDDDLPLFAHNQSFVSRHLPSE